MTDSPPQDDTLAAVLSRQAAQRGDAAALRFEGADLTYTQLQRQALGVASLAWHGWGIRPGDRVAWLGGNHPGELVLLFGLARIGAILLPLNFRLAPAEWDAIVAQCTPTRLVHDAALAAAARELAGRTGIACSHVTELAGVGEAAGAAGLPERADGDVPVLLVHTSGTTGGPKAAVHTQANLVANMRIAAQAQGITPADRILTVLPLFHVGGLCIQTLPALYAGAQVLLHPRFVPDVALDAIGQERPTLTLLVPATMKALLEHPRWSATDLASLRAVWAGSSLLPAALIDAFHARGVPVCNVYGSTETGPFSIALPPQHAFDHVGSCGWPADGVEARLGEAHGDAAEVLLRGPNVVRRYWPDTPALDAAGWFHTGDLARQAADGSFTIVGRARELIISGGENVHPAEVEQVLAGHPAVAECAAFGVPDERWGEAVAAAVVLKPGAQAGAESLAAHLDGRLARYKHPRRWLLVDALPKTALGKVRRSALARLADSPPMERTEP